MAAVKENRKTKKKYDPGKKLDLDEPEEEPRQEEEPEPPRSESREEKRTKALERRREARKTLPVQAAPWPRPSRTETAAASQPRRFTPQRDSSLTLTVGAIGIHDVPVINSNTREALDRGVIHLPQTPMPWEQREQKNVYLAGHRVGYPGTGSRLVFYNLDKLKAGDTVVLEDSLGEPYEYRVSEAFVVEPEADWVVDPVRGRDTVTLQTCTFPDLLNRLIVRADRV